VAGGFAGYSINSGGTWFGLLVGWFTYVDCRLRILRVPTDFSYFRLIKEQIAPWQNKIAAQ
jgi:hypothetical protein